MSNPYYQVLRDKTTGRVYWASIASGSSVLTEINTVPLAGWPKQEKE